MRMISEGRIRNLQQLKSAYRSLVLMTHPDAAGSDRLTDAFVRLSSDYDEARAFLEAPVRWGKPPRCGTFSCFLSRTWRRGRLYSEAAGPYLSHGGWRHGTTSHR
jgi:hypothetical protein